uniref:Uncharacterized protein n=1 Tax=Rhizophora mucronata TaxID=61149 RepID=A0A2P2QT76_RHIMU
MLLIGGVVIKSLGIKIKKRHAPIQIWSCNHVPHQILNGAPIHHVI